MGLFVVLAGCGSGSTSAPQVDVGNTQSAIQGGTVDKTHTFAVGISIGGKGPNLQAICSGALIAPNLVVTARHCVDNISSTQVDCSTTSFGALMYSPGEYWVTTSYTLFQTSTGWHQATKIVTPQPTQTCGNDLALIILADNVSPSEATPITPAVQYPITDHSHYSTTETAIGYGMTDPQNQNSAGTREIKQNINIQCIPGDKSLDCGNLANQGITANEFVSGDGTCEGDSGSSAYEQTSFNNGQPVSLGVLSRGGVSQDGTTCIGSVYTRLDSWKDLIISTAQQAAQAGGYPAPAWTYPPGQQPPPQDDAGTTSSDGGTTTGGDSGVSTAPAPGTLGASCSADGDCSSSLCRSYNSDTFTCTQACDPNNACPDGYACEGKAACPDGGNQCSFCFAQPKSNAVTTTTTTTGCAMSPTGTPDPKPVPWRWLAGGLIGLAALRRRRRR